MKQEVKNTIHPNIVWHGLLVCDRKTLSTFIAMFEDGKVIPLITSKILNANGRVKKTWSKFAHSVLDEDLPDDFTDDLKDNFASRINATTAKIEASDLSDDALRCVLWENLLIAFGLESDKDDVVLCPRDLDRVCADMANEISKNVSLQKSQKDKSKLGRINPFASKNTDSLSFEDAMAYLIGSITEQAINENVINESDIKDILTKSGISKHANAAITKNIAVSGGLLGVMGAVDLAGFGAYIMAAKASAIIPFVGGQTLVSLLAVVASPVFVISAIILTGAKANYSLGKSIKSSFATIISAILAMQGMGSKNNPLGGSNFPTDYGGHLKETATSDSISIKGINEKATLAKTFARDINVPDIHLSKKDKTLLASYIDIRKEKKKFIFSIKPESLNMVDMLAIGGLTFADFIYDLASIDPRVIAAADFARKDDLSNVFDFAIFTESLDGLAEASLRGHHSNIMGYTAERIVASQLVQNGHIVEIPESATQPGYDLLVDGVEFQVKCIEPDNFHILEKHFEKYPDTPVFANLEIAPIIAEKSPEWGGKVFYVEDYTHEQASGLVSSSIEAGQELDDYGIVSSIALVSAVRNTIEWNKGEQSFQSATFNVFLDSLSKGGMALVGGYAGAGVGMLLFGPAGYYILGGVSSVLGATKGSIITNHIDKVLSPERDENLKNLSNKLLRKCNSKLNDKIKLLNQKILSLPNVELSAYIRHRLEWERTFLKITIRRHNNLIKNDSINGNKKIIRALKFASESTIHPYCLQNEYNEIADVLEEKVDRLGKTVSFFKKAVQE